MNPFFKNIKEEVMTIKNMQVYGGSFVKYLAECYLRADPYNKFKLISAFKNYFKEYKNWGKKEVKSE